MASVKVAITLEQKTLRELDGLVARRVFPNRSRAIQAAVQEKLDRVQGTRLEIECSKLDRNEERALAEEGFDADVREWPEF